jgi:TolB-like protein
LLAQIVRHPALTQAEEQHSSQRSIAVLPIKKLGGDPQDDYFGDGLVEDITTELSHIPQLF